MIAPVVAKRQDYQILPMDQPSLADPGHVMLSLEHVELLNRAS